MNTLWMIYLIDVIPNIVDCIITLSLLYTFIYVFIAIFMHVENTKNPLPKFTIIIAVCGIFISLLIPSKNALITMAAYNYLEVKQIDSKIVDPSIKLLSEYIQKQLQSESKK